MLQITHTTGYVHSEYRTVHGTFSHQHALLFLNCTLCSRISTSRTHLIRFVYYCLHRVARCLLMISELQRESISFRLPRIPKNVFPLHARKKMIPDPPPAAGVVPGQRPSTAIRRNMTSPEAVFLYRPAISDQPIQKKSTRTRVPGCSPNGTATL